MKPHLALRPQRQHDHGIGQAVVGVPRHIASRAFADDELSEPVGNRPADKRVPQQEFQRIEDFYKAALDVCHRVLSQVRGNALNIQRQFGGQNQCGHALRGFSGLRGAARLVAAACVSIALGLGRCGFSPRANAVA